MLSCLRSLKREISEFDSAIAMSVNFFQRGGGWVLSQFGLALALVVCVTLWHGEWTNRPATALGSFLLTVSALCALAGFATLGRGLTPFPKPSPSAQLVRTGIYRLMRHPLYTAVFCGAVGWALVRRSWPALAIALTFAPFFDAKARREERWLRQQFPEYVHYERQVRRFLPWIY